VQTPCTSFFEQTQLLCANTLHFLSLCRINYFYARITGIIDIGWPTYPTLIVSMGENMQLACIHKDHLLLRGLPAVQLGGLGAHELPALCVSDALALLVLLCICLPHNLKKSLY
jgi:hypothetical protein